jgi:hypothetical protein
MVCCPYVCPLRTRVNKHDCVFAKNRKLTAADISEGSARSGRRGAGPLSSGMRRAVSADQTGRLALVDPGRDDSRAKLTSQAQRLPTPLRPVARSGFEATRRPGVALSSVGTLSLVPSHVARQADAERCPFRVISTAANGPAYREVRLLPRR